MEYIVGDALKAPSQGVSSYEELSKNLISLQNKLYYEDI